MKALFTGGCFFEGARWHDGAWYVSDMYGGTVWRITPDGEAIAMVELDGQPSGIGWLPDGDMLIVSMGEKKVLRRHAEGSLSLHADVAGASRYMINDMHVTGQGHAYVGNIGFDPAEGFVPGPTSLVHVSPDGAVNVAATGLLFPNGTVQTRDGRTLIVGESLGNRMTAFTVETDGRLTGRRVWAQFGPTPGPADYSMETLHALDLAPDGCAIDAEDCVWVADAANSRVCRIAEGGRILAEIAAPAGRGVFACALGGPDGRDLLICAAPGSLPELCLEKRGAVLYLARVEVGAT
jgi:sugar lactone lactonase YvrE